MSGDNELHSVRADRRAAIEARRERLRGAIGETTPDVDPLDQLADVEHAIDVRGRVGRLRWHVELGIERADDV